MAKQTITLVKFFQLMYQFGTVLCGPNCETYANEFTAFRNMQPNFMPGQPRKVSFKNVVRSLTMTLPDTADVAMIKAGAEVTKIAQNVIKALGKKDVAQPYTFKLALIKAENLGATTEVGDKIYSFAECADPIFVLTNAVNLISENDPSEIGIYMTPIIHGHDYDDQTAIFVIRHTKGKDIVVDAVETGIYNSMPKYFLTEFVTP